MASGPELVLDFDDALRVVLAAALARGTVRGQQQVALLDAAGRILAEELRADRDQPAFDRSTRDGFAVRAQELLAGPLAMAGQVRAGEIWPGNLDNGTAVEIMTGAPVPAGADAIVMVEHVSRSGGHVRINAGRTLSPAENIVPQASEARRGDIVVAAGTRVGAAEIAAAASSGYAHLTIVRRPKVAIVATGDELVDLSETPGPQQIRNSNGYALAALVASAGGQAERLPVARDLREEVRDRVLRGRAADLLLFSGGVSMGEYDLVEDVLAEFGAEFLFTGARMQPGKPVVFGRLPPAAGMAECYFFGLPGNPVSTQVTFHCFAEPFLRTIAGEAGAEPRWAQATLAEEVPGKAGLTRLLPCRVTGVAARLVGWQGSGDVAANARATCYAELLPGRSYAAGEVIRVLLR